MQFRKFYLVIALLAAGITAATSVQAQQLKITVTAVSGRMVQARQASDQPWQAAKVGMALSIGAEVRTGFKSAIEVKIEGGHTMVLDRMGVIKMLEAVKANGKITTNLGMKYGRVKYDVKAAGEEVDATVIAPSATLAIRGSTVEFQDDALGSYARGSGKLAYLPLDRRSEIAFGGNGESEVNDDEDSAVKVSRNVSVVNSTGMFTALTREEFENLLVKAGVTDNNQRDILEIQKLLDELGTDGIGVPELDGPLQISALWFAQDFFTDVDINLSVLDPLGNTLSAANPTVGDPPAQGLHFGDTTGAFNQEDAQWPTLFTQGTHTITLEHASGGIAADVFLSVFSGPGFTPVDGFDGSSSITLNPGQTVVIPVTPVP